MVYRTLDTQKRPQSTLRQCSLSYNMYVYILLGVACVHHLEDSHEDSPHKLCVVLVARATKQATLAQLSTLCPPQQSMILQALKWAVINKKITAMVAPSPSPLPHIQVIAVLYTCTQLQYATNTLHKTPFVVWYYADIMTPLHHCI